MSTEKSNHWKNELSVAGKVASDLPGQVWHDLKDDWTNHRGQLAEKVGISAAVGLATGLVFARSPWLAKAAFGLIGLGQASDVFTGSYNALKLGWNANTLDRQNSVASQVTAEIGRGTANFVEMAPASALGGSLGWYAARESPAVALTLAPVHKALNPESSFFRLGGTTVPEAANAAGGADLLQLSDSLSQMTPVSAVEEARAFRLGKGGAPEVSRAIGGNADTVYTSRMFDNAFHTHTNELLPSGQDYFAVRNVGIIDARGHGLKVFYEGLGDKLPQAKAALKSQLPLETVDQAAWSRGESPLSALVLDPQKRLAVGVQTFTDPARSPVLARFLDYEQATNRLRSWTGGRLNVSNFAEADRRMTPDMLDLLGKITGKPYGLR